MGGVGGIQTMYTLFFERVATKGQKLGNVSCWYKNLAMCCVGLFDLPIEVKCFGVQEEFQLCAITGNSTVTKLNVWWQWRNRWGGGADGGAGGQSAPQRLLTRKFCWCIRKKEARKKGKRGENWEKKENYKSEGGKLETEAGKVIKSGKDFFFSSFHFWKWWNFGGSAKMGKSISRREKIRKNRVGWFKSPWFKSLI